MQCVLVCCTFQSAHLIYIITLGSFYKVGTLLLTFIYSDFTFPFNNISDADFTQLFEKDASELCINYDILNYVVSDELDSSNIEHITDDVDPDYNFFQGSANTCKYWLSNDFNVFSESLSPSSFGMIHFNSRSLFKNFDSIHEFILQLKFTFSIIGFSETWINDCTPSLFSMDNYTFLHNDRNKSRGGGVGLMISYLLNVKPRKDLN